MSSKANKKIQMMQTGALVAFLAVFIFSPDSSMGKASPTGCPKMAEELKDVCSSESGKKQEECKKECGEKLKAWNDKVKTFQAETAKCEAKNGLACGLDGSDLAIGEPGLASRESMDKHKTAAKRGGQCAKDKADISKKLGEDQGKLCKEIKTSCEGKASGAEEEIKKCEKTAQEAKDTAKDNQKKADDMAKQEKKGDDNAKKQDSGGGMPQIPQIPQQKEEESTDNATSPTPASEAAVSEAKTPELEVSKLNDKEEKPNVGFGSTEGKAAAGSTMPPDASFDHYSGISENAFRTPATDFGGNPNTSGASTQAPLGGSSGGGLGSNSSGSSREPAPAEKVAESANPYEMPVGSGGRLGVPKGKNSGDSDTAVDAAATANFQGDFKETSEGDAAEQVAGEEEDVGYTVFKMVRYRYSELKKKGNI